MAGWTENDIKNWDAGRVGIPQPNRVAKTNKYRVAAKEERTVGLLVFASKAEAKAYQALLILQERGIITHLELQPVFKFPPGFEYRADFRATYADGRVSVIDVKGCLTPVFKLKRKCLEFYYPEVKLELWR